MTDIHKHCPICGAPIPLNESTCSEKCETTLLKRQKKIKNNSRNLFIVFAIFIAVWAYLTFIK